MTDVFDRFERQLIKAGRRLAAPTTTRRKRLPGRPAAVVVLVLALGGAAAAATLPRSAPTVSGAPAQPVKSGLSSPSDAPRPSAAAAAAVQKLLDNRPGQSSASGADLMPVVAQVASSGDRRAIVAAGPKFVCLDVRAGSYASSACTTHATAINPNTPMVDVTHIDSGFVVSAVVPDGVSDVVVNAKDGTSTPLALKYNFASAVTTDAPKQLVLTTAQGPKTVDLSSVTAAPTLGR